ncbi:nickel pincer cofactor biosynthesis protein LarB [Candidatus Sumerlaeota bacterium]|nr:nickel pincer cofactor biosynthesis protein LarB [Candidatus Sumerlaeota bacterium]
MRQDELKALLQAVASGKLNSDTALERLSGQFVDDLGDVCVDLGRERRCGMSEAVFCQGKTPKQIVAVMRSLDRAGQNILGTRCDAETARAVRRSIKGLKHHAEARILIKMNKAPQPRKGRLLVCCAGASDLPVAEEAALTAEFLGCKTTRAYDVGVAGLHRLTRRLDDLRNADVIVCCAGMEGALPSVVAGLVDCPVIAVPTSVGYGASFGGIAALLAMLNSCASGVSVVNIGNGFGASVFADAILRRL